MAEAQAMAEVFWRAFSSLSVEEKRAILERLLRDPRFQEDLLDISLILARQGEPSRPYDEFAEELRREGRL